jgi:hypothetical protein
MGKAWQHSATLKLIYAQDLPDLTAAIGAVPPCALIYRNGALKHLVTGEKLNLFLENFDISCDWEELEIKPVAPIAEKAEIPAATVETTTNPIGTPAAPAEAKPASEDTVTLPAEVAPVAPVTPPNP